jgi:hypothetical protein
MDALNELIVMMFSAVVGIFLFKLSMSVLPANPVTDPFKRIAAFL